MKKLKKALVWSLECIAAGFVGLMGITVEILFGLIRALLYGFIRLMVLLTEKSQNNYYKRRVNHALSETANEEIKYAMKLRNLRF